MAENNFSIGTLDTIHAYYVVQSGAHTLGSVKELPFSALPDNDVTIEVFYSSLNYKDALSARGLNRVTKTYPHIPGIDAAGIVLHDRSGTFQPGEQVVVTGNDLGTNTFGGYSSHIRVPADWVVKLPPPLTLEQSMITGTAGFTALYGIQRLKQIGFNTQQHPVLVTGATGGVGSFAVFALAQLGYKVAAATRTPEQNELLTSLGAHQILSSDDILSQPDKPLLSRKFAAAIETVGGELLDATLRQVDSKAPVACCGNILGMHLHTSILPFILRGISLLGIDSAYCRRALREKIWDFATTLNYSELPNNYYRIVELANLDKEIDDILKGLQTGRVVVKIK